MCLIRSVSPTSGRIIDLDLPFFEKKLFSHLPVLADLACRISTEDDVVAIKKLNCDHIIN